MPDKAPSMEIWEWPPWPHTRESWEEVKTTLAKYGLDAWELWTRNPPQIVKEK